ncbi:MAG TPA: amidohydrolase family protein [Candidatus Dormibacteraeota bacterium]|nr:amidohydrolase family protein [Candidatus Dormibacteraeota bacterium]
MAERKLIRGGWILTLDSHLGELQGGDLLIEGSQIAALGRELPADGAEVIQAEGMIVLPGFVDTHRHTWQSLARAAGVDWTLAAYFQAVRGMLGETYRPQDLYTANLLGIVEALDSGITTMLDWSHLINSPEHADAAVAGLQASGARAVFAYGNANAEWGNLPNPTFTSEDIRRVRSEHFASSDQLVTMALAARGPQFSTIEATEFDWRLARELGLRITTHVGDGLWGIRSRPIQQLHDRGLLGPDTTYVHCNTLSSQELRWIADSGGSASLSPEIEMNMGHGFPATGKLLGVGVRPSLSIDVVTTVVGNMFGVMRAALSAERALNHQKTLDAGIDPTELWLSAADVLAFATLEGARALGLEAKIGSLTPGKQADVIVVDTSGPHMFPLNDAVNAVVAFAQPHDVRTVLVGGRVVKREGRLVDIDMARLRADAEAARDYLFQQSGVTLGEDWFETVQPQLT